MTTSLTQVAAAQIRVLIDSLTEDNLKPVAVELYSLIETFGPSARTYLLAELVQRLRLGSKDQQSASVASTTAHVELLQQEVAQVVKQANASSVLSQVLAPYTDVSADDGVLQRLLRRVTLAPLDALACAVALVSSSEPTLVASAKRVLRAQLPVCIPDLTDPSVSPLRPSLLHPLLLCLAADSDLHAERERVCSDLRKNYPPHAIPAALHLFVFPTDSANSMNTKAGGGSRLLALANDAAQVAHVASILKEAGVDACKSTAELKSALEPCAPLSERDVAECLAMMTAPAAGLPDVASTPVYLDAAVAARKRAREDGLDEGAVAGAITAAEASSPRAPAAWDVEAFIKAAGELSPNLDWSDVPKHFDSPRLFIGSSAAFAMLLAAYRAATRTAYPLDHLWEAWDNPRAQLSFLAHAVLAPRNVFDFAASRRRMLPPDNVPISVKGPANNAWYSRDLVATLVALGKHDPTGVRAVLDVGQEVASDLLAIALSTMDLASGNTLHQDAIASVLLPYINNQTPNAIPVLRHISDTSSDALLRVFAEVYRRDNNTLSRILDVAQELKALSQVFNARPWSFVIDLAALASRREYLNLGKWLQMNIQQAGDVFITACLTYIKDKVIANRGDAASRNAQQSLLETITVFFRILQNNASLMSAELSEEVRQVFPNLQLELFALDVEDQANSYFQKIYMGQMSIRDFIELLKAFKVSTNQKEREVFTCMIHYLFDEYRFFPKYPEKELRVTGVLFGSLIQHGILTQQPLSFALSYVLQALRKPVDSKMFRFGLYAFEQFKWRLHEWPQIGQHLLQIPTLRQEHREIIEWVEKVMVSPAGAGAPGAAGSSSSAAASAAVAAAVAAGGSGNVEPLPRGMDLSGSGSGGGSDALPSAAGKALGLPPTSAAGGASGSGGADNSPRSATGSPSLRSSGKTLSFDIDAQLTNTQKLTLPPTQVQDKIHFIFNNVAASNMDQKARELADLLKPEYYAYLGQYVVLKRAVLEANHHQMYLAFLERLNEPRVFDAVYARTLDNVRLLLASDKVASHASSEERGLLKNIGSWLGCITLARNKPLLQKDLDLKQLVHDAYDKGRLLAVLPFVSKILETSVRSRVFKPPNPWLMGIVSMLVELYAQVSEMNLKFEVQLLVQKLGLDLGDITPTSVFKDREVPDAHQAPAIAGAGAFAQSAAATGGLARGHDTAALDRLVAPSLHTGAAGAGYGVAGQLEMLQHAGAGGPAAAAAVHHGGVPAPAPHSLTPYLAEVVKVSPNLGLLMSQPQLKRLVPAGIDRAVREIISPVVERSVTIACITTRELVLKDFAMESDESKVRAASHHMVQNLAGNLALVTCKDPLRASMTTHVRALLHANTSAEQHMLVDQVTQVLINDNLDLACNLIEKAAMEKAVKDMDDTLAPHLAIRRKHRENGQPYFDMTYLAQHSNSRYPAALPEQLRPKTGGVTLMQQRVYETFGRAPPTVQRGYPGGSLYTGSAGVDDAAAAAAFKEMSLKEQAQQQVQAQQHGGYAGAPPPPPPPPQNPQVLGEAQLTAHQVMDQCNDVLAEAQSVAVRLTNQGVTSLASLAMEHDVFRLVRMVPRLLQRSVHPVESSISVAHKVFKELYRSDAPLFRELHLALLEVIRELCPKLVKELTTWLVYSDEERKLHRDICVALIRGHLIHVGEYTAHIAKLMDTARNKDGIVDFALWLVQRCLLDQHVCTSAECLDLLLALQKTLFRRKASDHVLRLLDEARQVSVALPPHLLMPEHRAAAAAAAASSGKDMAGGAGVRAVDRRVKPLKDATFQPDPSDPPGSAAAIADVFADWVRMQPALENAGADAVTKQVTSWLSQRLHTPGLLRGDAELARLVRISTQCVVMDTYGTQGTPQHSYAAADAATRLFLTLVLPSSVPAADGNNSSEERARVKTLAHVLNAVVDVMARDFELRRGAFNQQPYFRILSGMLVGLTSVSASSGLSETTHFHFLTVFGHVLHTLQPQRLPPFAFAWLELVSHRALMPKLLLQRQQGWPLFQRLLLDLFRFLEPYLRSASLTDPVRLLYKGVLRVLLVLLHDFPQFLCDYHFSFCDVIPLSCIQMRNLILSASPRNMRLPDPFTPNLKVDLLPEINENPRILSPVAAALNASGLRHDLDTYLRTRAPKNFLPKLSARLMLPADEARKAGTRYSVPTLHALVLYVGIAAVEQLQSKQQQQQGESTALMRGAPMDVFQHLAADLDAEGRYLFLNAVANQLRYPNSHTHYFSCVLLRLFAEATQDVIQEQITRVLVERLIGKLPHPWGLLITFIELIKNPRYNFWNYSFTRSAPEIEHLFQSLMRSCMAAPAPQRGIEADDAAAALAVSAGGGAAGGAGTGV